MVIILSIVCFILLIFSFILFNVADDSLRKNINHEKEIELHKENNLKCIRTIQMLELKANKLEKLVEAKNKS